MISKCLHQCNCPERPQIDRSAAPVKLTPRKVYTPVKRSTRHAHNLHRLIRCSQRLKHRCNHRRAPKTLTGDKTTHRLIRRTRMQASVQPAIRKNPARAEQSFSSPCSLEILSIEDPKQVQSSPKFAGTITKTL